MSNSQSTLFFISAMTCFLGGLIASTPGVVAAIVGYTALFGGFVCCYRIAEVVGRGD